MDYIDDFIQESTPYKAIFGEKLDRRMRDVELVLRFVAFERFFNQYKGNLKNFLDETVIFYDKNWHTELHALDADLKRLNDALITAKSVFGENTFKKWNGDKYEARINRAIFDVITRYFADDNIRSTAVDHQENIVANFKTICTDDQDFKNAIERTTKTPSATITRYRLWGESLANELGLRLDEEQMRLL